jgi:acyl-CoA synthetase (NDP forming)/RimJ/RimL family protein N-acetyltransferase
VSPDEAGYPTHWEADVVLRDGGTAHVRPIRPEDADALQTFHMGQSQRSTVFRFFAPLERLPERDLARFTHVDHHDRVAFVAVEDDDAGERIIAVARYDRDGDGAEVAFNVADAHHGRGLGSVLLEHLTAAARERGIRRFTAEVLPHNARMLAVFRDAGYAVTQHLEDGILTVTFDIDPTERSLAVTADREQRAEARSMGALLAPASVLVLAETGPGADPALATAAARHVAAPAGGPVVHVVGLDQDVPGATRWGSVGEVPGTVDLVVLSVPAAHAAAAVRACARLRPRGLVVISGGFAETGADGLDRQRELLRAAHGAGMRVLGPASYGFLRQAGDGTPTVHATLAAEPPPPGRLALFCHSAPLAVGLLASVGRRGLGLSTFVSAGHRADVSGNDVMQFFRQDDATSVVGMYLESIGNPRKFARVARRLATTTPVVAVIAGRSGHVVPAGHAVRRTRVPRRALDEMLRQSGVIRVDSQHQLLDVAQFLVHQPLPGGRRVAVLASSGALAALTAEAASSAGLTVGLQRALPPGGRHGDADLERLDEQLAEVYADQACDAVVVVHVPTLGGPDPHVAEAVARAAAASGRPTVACILGLSGITAALTAPRPDGGSSTVPAYATPEDAVTALAAAARHATWRAADHGSPLAPAGVDRATARRLVAAVLEHPSSSEGDADAGDGPDGAPDAGVAPGAAEPAPVRFVEEQTRALLAAYGIEVWPTFVVHDLEEAREAAEQLGWPVVLKSGAAHLRHRIDLGAVRLDLDGPRALAEALRTMQAHLPDGGPWHVQRMAPPGAACVIRSAEDPRFGPVVSFGLAGDAVDLLGDISYGIAPLSDTDVAEMVRAVRAGPRLFGYRGQPSLDVAALEDVLGRVAVMADDLPELRSVELHPVVVGERGAAVLSARVRVAPAGRVDTPRRVLPA